MMFTIIFPVLNERLRLESGVTRTVEYLRSIAFEDYEIIIVDNGSEDETPQIAEKLCLSLHTVITHRRNIAGKLQIHSPAGLTIYAIVNKLVELSEIKETISDSDQ